MKILDLLEAKKLASQIFEKFTPKLHKDFQMVHSNKVGIVAKIIAKKLNIYSDVFEIAGRVHDIGYIKDSDKHAEYSIQILKDSKYEIDDVLKDCILNHGNSKIPETIEGRIFQLADKISVFDSDLIEVFVNEGDFPLGKDSKKFLKNVTEKSFKVLEEFSKNLST